MIKFAERHSQEEAEKILEPIVLEWFKSKYKRFSQPQIDAIYHIHSKENVLVSSPTGTGKTLAAFLDIISQLIQLYRNGNDDKGVKVIYVSPLKALINDIKKNLLVPLEEMKSGLKEIGFRT